MITRIKKRGDSLMIPVPDDLAQELDFHEGKQVEVTRVTGGLLIRKSARAYMIDELLQLVTPENLHGETDWGPPVGSEGW